jgi:hypothetical protein
METFTCPFFISDAFIVVTGANVTAGVVVFREGVTDPVEEFTAFVCLIVGTVHPATRTQPIIIRNKRRVYFFISISVFLPCDEVFLIVIFYQLVL